MTKQIIHAATLWHQCGRYAARRYCEKRGLDLRLVRLARQLHATKDTA